MLKVKEAQAEAEAKAMAIESEEAKTKGGFVVARTFNSFINVFNHHQTRMGLAAQDAIHFYRSEFPQDLKKFNQLVEQGKPQEARQFLDNALARAQDKSNRVEAAFSEQKTLVQTSNKYWSSLAADIGSGLAVLTGAALTLTGAGAPAGAGLVAAGVSALTVGGAASVASHAMLDNQYDLKEEGLSNFLVGGLGSAAMLATGGASTAVTMGQLAMRQGIRGAAISGGTGFAGATAEELQNGFANGAFRRIATATAISTGTGFVVGQLMPRATTAVGMSVKAQGGVLANQALQVGIGSTSGALGQGIAGTTNEAVADFAPGWQDRVVDQAMRGAISGGVMGLAPKVQWGESTESLRIKAYGDALTGLKNRAGFNQATSQAAGQTRRRDLHGRQRPQTNERYLRP